MPNQFEEVIPKLLAQGLMALREVAVMPLIVNRAYDEQAGQRGSTIDVPIPSAIEAQDVAPSNTPPATDGVQPTSVPIQLDRWKEAPFYLSDKEQMEVVEGTIPMQASEAVRSLANVINQDILGLYKGVYGFAGEAGTTPFGSNTSEATEARKILNQQLAPMDPRHMVVDPDAEANALDLRAFQDMGWSGTAEAIINGTLDRRLGFAWHMHQMVPEHSAGDAGDSSVDGSHAAGVTEVAVTGTTHDIKEGDIVTFAGHDQTYVAKNDLSSDGNLEIAPKLQVALDGGEDLSVEGDHMVNLAFHRDGMAFATRPLEQQGQGLGSLIQSAVDPLSGLTLRIEVSREHKRLRYSYDVLYGVGLVRPELVTRLAG